MAKNANEKPRMLWNKIKVQIWTQELMLILWQTKRFADAQTGKKTRQNRGFLGLLTFKVICIPHFD